MLTRVESEIINQDRRQLLTTAAMGVAAAGSASLSPASAVSAATGEAIRPFRIHIPIVTNDGAYLLSEGRAKHLAAGEVWTFDNQSMHAVTNGDAVRAHLIFDVPRRPTECILVHDHRVVHRQTINVDAKHVGIFERLVCVDV